MKPRLVTFDCAQTLVDVRWAPHTCMRDCAEALGVSLPEGAELAYGQLFVERIPEYQASNRQGDLAELEAFWGRLTYDWLGSISMSEHAEAFLRAAGELAYGSEGLWFRAYDDADSCLQRLRADGYKLAVVSNWDLSLPRILELAGLSGYFDEVVISLKEGVEKPDPRLFAFALERTGSRPEETVHVGDNPVDDGEGACAAGVRHLIVDRGAPESGPGLIRSLDELPEAFAWSV